MQVDNKLQDNIYLIISLIALVAFMGLFYHEPWQYPVIDSFPLIERILDPTYLNNDFYTNTFNDFSPRLILASCIAWTSEFLNIHYTYVVAYGNMLRIWLYAIGLYLFFKQLSNNNQIAIIAFALSALSFLSVPFLPAWWPVTFDFTASNVALTFSMFAWTCALKNKGTIAIVLLAISVLFHPLVGVHSSIISLILYLSFQGWKEFIDLLRKPSVYVAATLYSIVFLTLYFSFDKILDDNTFVEINAVYRHSHHFIFSHMEIEKWISTGVMLIISIGLCIKLDMQKPIKLVFIAITSYAFFITIMGYIFIEIIPTRFMVSFIPMRAFPVLVPIIVLVWSIFSWQTFNRKNYIAFYLLFLPFIPYNHVGLTWFLFPNQHELFLPVLITIMVFIVAVITNRWKILTHTFNGLIENIEDRLSIKLTPSMLVLPIAISALMLSIVRFEINIPNLSNEAAIYKWINKNTDKDAVILTDLDAANNQKIRLISNRAVLVSKDFPFNEKHYKEWYQRYSDVYLEKDVARGRINKLDYEELNSLMDRYNTDILIRTKPLKANPYLSLIGKVDSDNSESFIYKNINMGSL